MSEPEDRAEWEAFGRTLYYRNRMVGSVYLRADAVFLAKAANDWKRLQEDAATAHPGQMIEHVQVENPGRMVLHNEHLYPPAIPTGERLDAERRGETAPCAHHGNWYWDPETSRSRCCACDELVGTSSRYTQGRDTK